MVGRWGSESGARGLACVLTIVAAAAMLLAAPAGAQAATSTTATMLTEGEYIGGSQQRFFYPGNGVVSVSGSTGQVSASVSGGTHGDSYSMSFAAPSGKTLAPGLYTDAQRTPFREAGRPGINISGDGRGCNEQGGRFDIKDIAFDGTGKLTRVWLVYEQHCENGTNALFGEVRFNMPTTTPNLVVAQREIWWPDADPGRTGVPVPVFVANDGTQPRAMGRSEIVGQDAADFRILDDACDRRVIAPGELCKVWVRIRPGAGGPRNATLQVRDENGIADRVALSGTGRPGRSSWSTGFGDANTDPVAFDSFDAAFGASGSHRTITLSATKDAGGTYSATFDAGTNDILGSGRLYPGATVTTSSSTLGPKLKVTGTGINCTAAGGSFTVNWITYTPDDRLQDADISFEQNCTGKPQPLKGRLRYHSLGPQPQPPPPPSDLVLLRSGSSAHLRWTNPPSDTTEIVVRYLEGTQQPPGNPQSGVRAYAGSGSSTTFSGLTPGRPLAVSVFSVDEDGMTNRATITTDGVDTGPLPPPETTIDGAPAARSASRTATFAYSSDYPDATFECSLDAAAFEACPSPREVRDLTDGPHQFAVRAVIGGVVDPTPATHEWSVDTVAPETSFESKPPSASQSNSAHFDLASTESGSGFECSLDGAAFASCGASVDLTGLADGQHVFRARAVDAAGNRDGSAAEHTWTVDATGPSVSISSTPPASTTDTQADFSFTSPEASATFECRLDAGAWLDCTSPTHYGGLSVGTHSFAVRGTDEVGNVGAGTAGYSWQVIAPPAPQPQSEPQPQPQPEDDPPDAPPVVGPAADTDPPLVAFALKPDRRTVSRQAQFSFTIDEPARFECALDDRRPRPCASSVRYRKLEAGRHSFSVTAIDQSGNAGIAEYRWKVSRRP